jgi:hypothetical protein
MNKNYHPTVFVFYYLRWDAPKLQEVYCWGYPKNPDKTPEHKTRECKDVQEHK